MDKVLVIFKCQSPAKASKVVSYEYLCQFSTWSVYFLFQDCVQMLYPLDRQRVRKIYQSAAEVLSVVV